MQLRTISAAILAVAMALAVSDCCGQEETTTTEPELLMAMVNEEGEPWWDPAANTSVQYQEGDITFITDYDLDSGREKRGAIRNRFFLWTNAIVPFTISSTFSSSERNTIIESMMHWEEHTCLRFVPRTTQADYVHFYRGSGCHSYIGRVRRQQGISLGTNCVVPSVVIHEIGHAVGFFHEQSRPDRDDYIRIINENIQPGAESQFRIESESRINSLGVGYDYNSIMHYDPGTFAIRGREAIQALDPDITVGNAEELSPLDILQTQLLYRCSQIGNRPSQLVRPPTPPLALPSGIQCGRVFQATSGSFESPGYPSFRHNQRCAWVISAPEGYELRITIRGLSVDQSSGCSRDFIQFHRGRTMGNPIRYFGYTDGRICDRLSNFQRITFPTGTNEAVVYFQTDGSNSQNGLQGFQASFEARDINECRFSGCDNCVNTPGSFECTCNDGFYLSPAAERCFDVNECAIQNGGCEHTCVNRAGGYRCQCNSGFNLQGDGRSCRRPGDEITIPTTTATTQPTTPTTAATTRPTTPTTAATTRPTTPTTAATTRPPTSAGPMFIIEQTSPGCDGYVTIEGNRIVKSPNWPATYPVNLICDWEITVSDPNRRMRIEFDNNFGIAGRLNRNCNKDTVVVYDGHESNDPLFGTYCEFTAPPNLQTSSNKARIILTSLDRHNPIRVGFQATLNIV